MVKELIMIQYPTNSGPAEMPYAKEPEVRKLPDWLKNLGFHAPFLFIALIINSFCFAQTGSKLLIIGSSDLFHSKILNEDRIVNIYLPENYQRNDTIKYPVIYVLDGGIEEDFVHIKRRM